MQREFRISAALRRRLAEPIGRLIVTSGELAGSVSGASMVVTVGDRVTETVGALGRVPDVQIVDGLERRKKRKPPDVPARVTVRVKNPPGSITTDAVAGLKRAFGGPKPARVLVEGEEDLLAIPALAFSPIGSTLYYGQPGAGVVVVKVDAAAKSRNRSLMDEIGMPKIL